MRKSGVLAVFVALLPGATVLQADEPGDLLLKQSRAWRGFVEVEAHRPPDTRITGDEIQKERVEFVAVTNPGRTGDARHRLQLKLVRSTGKWSLKLDLRESKGAGEVATRGSTAGAMNFTLDGVLDVRSGAVRLRFGTRAQRILAKTTMSGMDGSGFATFRNVATRRTILDGLVETGALNTERSKASGDREFVLKRGAQTRKVRIRWMLERLEPEVRGRILDQHGSPIAGLRVVARTLSPAGPGVVASTIMIEGKSDADGRFRIPAKPGTWGVEIPGRVQKGVLTRGWAKSDAVQLRFDNVPDLAITAVTYRLDRLPRSHLLARNFRNDVDRYMEYVERRNSKARLAAARVPKQR